MFCPKCGTENPNTGKFCRNCGVDLGNVSEALSGKLKPIAPITDRRGKKVSWESAIGKISMGVAFMVVASILGITGAAGSKQWWFWLLIPAFAMLGAGVAQIIQIQKAEKEGVNFAPADYEKSLSANSPNSALPPSQNDYIKPQGSIYDTGEFVAPPSVIEGTTRHLEINKEGETMTLPKNDLG